MQLNILNLIAVSLFATQATAETISVDVGKGGKKFSPDSITAKKGDVVEFHFHSKHSVVAGDFDNACKAAGDDGFYSGMKGSGTFAVTINSTDPIFLYCSKGNHCKKGMVGVINPSDDKTLDAYRSKAKSGGNGESPKSEFGGKSSDAGSLQSPALPVLAAVGVMALALA